tara:strand:+ start:355 stop:495 length:141 start_codon:yes stop_codon:yes gene_type:complete
MVTTRRSGKQVHVKCGPFGFGVPAVVYARQNVAVPMKSTPVMGTDE